MLFNPFGIKSKPDTSEVFIEFNDIKVKLQKKIGQDKHSYIYSAQDEISKKMYSVKQTSAADITLSSRNIREIENTKMLQSSKYVIKYYDDIQYTANHFTLFEYCPMSLVSFIRGREAPLKDVEIVKICGQITLAIEYMHSMKPPIINRNFKTEDIWINQEGFIRLSNFTDITNVSLDPAKLSHKEKCEIENKIDKTNPCYVVPEMLDLYLNYIINEKTDIWALGCIYYFICKSVYPFNPQKNADILGLRYTPIDLPYKDLAEFVNLILRNIFQILPSARPSALALAREWRDYAEKLNISIETPVFTSIIDRFSQGSLKTKIEHIRPVNIIESLKETRNKIREQMKPLHMKKKKIISPIEFITSRLAISPCPSEQTDQINAEQISGYLNEKYASNYILINLVNNHNYPISLFENRVITYKMHESHAPNLNTIIEILTITMKFLAYDVRRIVVFHDNDNGYLSLFVISILLIYSRAFKHFKKLLEYLIVSRSDIEISAAHCSFLRYGEYVEVLSYNPGISLLKSFIHVSSLTITPIILCNKLRTGCRPFLTIEIDDNLVFSTLDDPRKIRHYTENDNKIQIPLDASLYGNVRIIVYHISFIHFNYYQKKLFSFQFHTAFLNELDKFSLKGSMLDISSPRYLSLLQDIEVEMKIDAQYRNNYNINDPKKNLVSVASPQIYFSGQPEYQAFSSTVENAQEEDFLYHRLSSLVTRQMGESQSSSNFNVSEELTSSVKSRLDKKVNVESKSSTTHQDDLLLLFNESSSVEPSSIFDVKTQISEKKVTPHKNFLNFDDPLTGLSDFPSGDFISSKQYDFDNSSSNNSLPSSQRILSEPTSIFIPPQSKPQLPNDEIFKKTNIFGLESEFSSKSKTSFGSHDSLFSARPHIHDKTFFLPISTYNQIQIQPKSADSNIQSRKNSHTYAARTNDVFQDILKDHGFVKNDNNPYTKTSLVEAQKRLQDNIKSDPVSKAIYEWTNGKNKNIKLLLSTFGSVIWCPEKWQNITIADLNDFDSVKKAVRKACLLVHPDKLIGSEHEDLAKAIFCELNEAWNIFENKRGKTY